MKIIKVESILAGRVFIKISTDEGITGWGEALGTMPKVTASVVQEFARYLTGKDPTRIEHHWQAMYRIFWRGGITLTAAISGVEMALWDILGKSLDVPVYQLLGGRCRDRIRVYITLYDRVVDNDSWLKMMEEKKITAIKFCPFTFETVRSIEGWGKMKKAVERVKKMREKIGDETDMLIECSGKMSPSMAVVFCEEIAPYHPFFVEEPCPPENMDAMAQITERVGVPIATGERIFTKFGFVHLLERTKVAAIQPDLSVCGGIMEAKKIAAMAEARHIGIAPHNCSGPVLTAASLQIDSCTPNFIIQECCFLESDTLGEGTFKKPFEIKDGYVEIPTGPGLGIEVDEKALKKRLRCMPRGGVVVSYHEDGAVAEWAAAPPR